jgi:hypothetical protein
MKKTYIIPVSIAFNALLCLFLALPATAQHRDGGNNSGSGSTPPPTRQAAPPPSNGGGGQRTYSAPPQQQRATVQQQPQQRAAVQQQRPNVANAPRQQVSIPRQGIAPGQRGVSASVQIGLSARPAYRSYPGLPGSNGVTRVTTGRPYGGYYNAHGYYNSFYGPHLGFRLNVLPYGYYPFYFGPYQYFYSDGLYYQYENSQYTVVEPPVGAAISTLPDNAQSIMINGIQYYELNGVYYQPITKDDGSVVYQVAGKDGELNTDQGDQGAAVAPPQIGDIVAALPNNCKTIRINGQKYYVSPDDYYYQDATDNNNNKVYKIVGTPTDEPNQ